MDDEEKILNLVSDILLSLGLSVSTVSDGQQAIEKYKQALDNAEPFDAVLMDLTIPGGIGGKEAIKEILKIDPEAKCLITSGHAGDTVMTNYDQYGFKGIIKKPFRIKHIQDSIKQILVN